MSEKTYTAAEVAELIEKAKAELSGAKPVTVQRKTGIRKNGEKKGTEYSGFEIRGNFFPIYLSENVASQIAAVDITAMLKLALASPRLEPKVKPALAPRLAPTTAAVAKA